jgi:hypothetical protein
MDMEDWTLQSKTRFHQKVAKRTMNMNTNTLQSRRQRLRNNRPGQNHLPQRNANARLQHALPNVQSAT